MRLAGKKEGEPTPTVYIRITTPNGRANAHITVKDCTVAVVCDLIQGALDAAIDKRKTSEEHAHAGAS